ncbi:fibronectin type III domain-containing protein [Mesoflavibacter sp. SCSIO 43206]|uniref:fibronectin type III domain-containing protein n=1 Tax=Mesoflavibacter sp. SCSIO 43206 TaxID=2779362 RepID=UPI001CAA0D98|nr:fibronectin type III domain-containing protein [Mesoflavibacter sp. SCSIO 43206]UAB75386.1 choice-of-anchor J domain-containing protein [Mesoflavibacter sp. SCSIO 43206]
MKKITLLLFAIFSLTFCWQSMAQVTVGTGTYTNAYSAYPLGAFYGYSYAQSIYLASEINASGDITAITFEMADADAIPNSDDMIDLWIGHTTKVEFDTTSDWVDVSTLTQVMTSGTLTKSGTTITFTFNAPFTYNGTDNLIIALDASEPNYDTSGDMIVGTNVGANRTLRHISDSVNFDPEAPITGVLTNYIGNATFMGIAQACPSPSDLTATNIMTTSADLSWTAGGTETLWNVEIVDVTAGGTVTGTVTDSGVANPFLASGLTPDNSYEYYVQADCGGDTSAWVGPFSFSTLPTCAEPSSLTITNITTTSADLSWTVGGTETSWNIELVDVTAGGTVTGTATSTGITNPYTLSGLTAGNQYEYYVQADCGGGDTSTWVGPYTFTTLCNPITSYPWSEDFESVSTPDLPSCWSHINNNGDTDNWRTYTTYGVGGSTTAGLYTDFNSGNNDDYLVLPQFTLTGNERLKFSVRARSSSEPNDYRVVLSTSGSTPTDFTEELLPLTQVSSTTQTEIAPIDLSSYTGDVYIAIHVPSGGLDGYYIYFDEFVVEPIPSCVEPSDLTATNIMATSADLGWTENGTASTYNVEVVLAGDAATGTATDTAVANGFTKSGLTDNTDYEFYVQAICGGDTSVWSGPYAFTTLCAAIVPNYIADFSTIAPSCWTEGNNTDVATGPDGNNGSWTNDDFLNTVGIEAAKINLYSNTQQDWLVSPVFDFSSGGYGLAFDVGVTAWNSTVAETPNLMGSDDEVLLLISEDNGVTWTTLEAFNVENAPSHTGDNKIYDLSTITSSTVKFAFWATEGSVDDAEDIDFFVANFNVDSYATLGVSEVEDKATFTYYPNPVNNNLTLSAQKEINNVSVYNMVGQEVFRNVPNAMTEVVDMSSLQAGAYFVKVTIGNATKTVKVIKN